ncbi:restriction endonuclease subunit S [Aeromonas hydrophila]|uniref:restriction endonuclease subunit S n=1 Tax=Aeromonas hydrophila TaxID=644 RepID=UPI0035B9D1A5
MDAQQFLAEFGHIANAQGGVQRLREMVYQLAITGKLTSQLDTDGDAHELLTDISTLRERLIRDKSYKRLPKLENEPLDIPSTKELPASWCWTRLLDLGEISPRNDAPDKADASFIPMSGFSEFHMGALASQAEKWAHIKKGFTHFKNGDVVVAKITPCFENGKAAVIDGLPHEIGAGTTELHVFRPIHSGILPGYIYLFLRSPYFAIEGEKCMTGTAGQKRLPTEYFATRALPLPPTIEQSRIVAKVDELMALCDTLEAQQQDRRKLQNSLRQATLQALTNATSSHELQTTWAHLANDFMWLFHAPEDVDDVIAALKSLAVRGLLVEASVTSADLEAIKADCSQLRGKYINDGLMRRQKLVSMAENETIYPNHWAIAPFDEVAIVIGGVTKGRNLRGKQIIVCPYLAVANVQRGHFKLDGLKTIEIAADELAKYQVQKGDLLITEGGDWDKVGRTAIWRGEITNCLHQNHVFKARVPSKQLLNEWVELVFNSNIGRAYFAGASKQTTNLASINMTQLRSFALPIPPLDEQTRIITLLAELTSQCTEWRHQLQRKQSLSALLANAVISTLIGLTIEQEEEPMRAPQTELIAPLCLGTVPDIKAQAPLATILARHNGEMSAKDLWQRFGGEIDAFYAQLKIEVAHGWILEPTPAEMREKPANAEIA